jgi:hypothetical protein
MSVIASVYSWSTFGFPAGFGSGTTATGFGTSGFAAGVVVFVSTIFGGDGSGATVTVTDVVAGAGATAARLVVTVGADAG